jgi:hypothetical protein
MTWPSPAEPAAGDRSHPCVLLSLLLSVANPVCTRDGWRQVGTACGPGPARHGPSPDRVQPSSIPRFAGGHPGRMLLAGPQAAELAGWCGPPRTTTCLVGTPERKAWPPLSKLGSLA